MREELIHHRADVLMKHPLRARDLPRPRTAKRFEAPSLDAPDAKSPGAQTQTTRQRPQRDLKKAARSSELRLADGCTRCIPKADRT